MYSQYAYKVSIKDNMMFLTHLWVTLGSIHRFTSQRYDLQRMAFLPDSSCSSFYTYRVAKRSNGFVSIQPLAQSTIVHNNPCVNMDRTIDTPRLAISILHMERIVSLPSIQSRYARQERLRIILVSPPN